ncbi:hypothetical protein [Microtetraspora malaysiensis]|uniref:Uncharacterized protein n=1 Tax=Microtetraspora malaysiensis TaxID=161358 RepID=A0ABW6SMI9_9ACTN
MAVCVDSGFAILPDGRLTHHIAGDPAPKAWPYTCPPGQNNPIRLDPDLGLWLPPYPKAGTASASGQTSSTQRDVPDAWTEVETAEITVRNPSTCHPAICVQFVQADVDFYLPAGTNARAGYRLYSNSMMAVGNGAPASGTAVNGVHWEGTQVIAGGTIPAGGSATFTALIEVGSGRGNAQYGQIRWQYRVLMLAGMQ